MLGAVLATIHFGLVLGDDRRSIAVALIDEGDDGNVRVHELAVAEEVHAPEVRPESVLPDGLVGRLGHDVPGIAVTAIPHVQRALQELGARLGRVRRAERIRLVEVVEVLGSDRALVVLEARVRGLRVIVEEAEHLLDAE